MCLFSATFRGVDPATANLLWVPPTISGRQGDPSGGGGGGTPPTGGGDKKAVSIGPLIANAYCVYAGFVRLVTSHVLIVRL
jgi:hypothetical protein